MVEIRQIEIERLVQNTGQIEGVPSNPRQWTKVDVDILAKSLVETPELFEYRCMLVYPLGDKFVILGGNLRYEASKQIGLEVCPCIIVPADTPADTLCQIIIKDNGSFGGWDYDALANEWDDKPLTDWGVPAWKVEGIDMDAVDALFQPTEPKEKATKVVVTLPDSLKDKADDIKAEIRLTLDSQGYEGIVITIQE